MKEKEVVASVLVESEAGGGFEDCLRGLTVWKETNTAQVSLMYKQDKYLEPRKALDC